MLPDTTSNILELVTKALDEFETMPLSASVRRAWRISRLRGDILESIRFALELGVDDDLGEIEPSSVIADLRELANAVFADNRYTNIESRLLGLDAVSDLTLQPLENLSVEKKSHEAELSFKTRVANENKRVLVTSILARIRNDTYKYLMRCETSLRLSLNGERIFDRHRETVERRLRKVAPEVLDMLNSAIRRASIDDDPESRVHALTTCRRVLTAVADIVYPASDEPYIDGKGKSRNVGGNQYRNRLVAAVEIAGSTTQHQALAAGIDEFANRLERLDELTQKGVHAKPTVEDVDFGVIHTYMIAGEVLVVSARASEESPA